MQRTRDVARPSCVASGGTGPPALALVALPRMPVFALLRRMDSLSVAGSAFDARSSVGGAEVAAGLPTA